MGSDHAGFKLKEKLKKFLEKKGVKVEDIGTYTNDPVDYPIYAEKVTKLVKKKKLKGILICGTGTGMCMAANRVKGIRATTVYDNYSCVMSRKHNDANVICLRSRRFSSRFEKGLVWKWLNTEFSKIDRHKRRIRMLG